MTLETSPADAAPTRRSRRRPPAPVAAEGHEAPATPVEVTSLAESAVVAGVTAAIAQVANAATDAAQPLTRAELRRRRAAEAAASAVTDEAPVVIASLDPVPAADPQVVASPAVEVLHVVEPSQPAAARRRRARAESAPQPATETLAKETLAKPATEAPAKPAADAAPQPAAEQLAGTAFSAIGSDEACLVEDFDFSARLFAFTGETPVQVAAAALADDADEPATRTADVASRGRRRVNGRSALKRLAGVSFSLAVMSTVGLLAVGTTTPASIAAAVTDTTADITAAIPASAKTIESDEIQAYVAASDLTAGDLDRTDSYDIASMADIAADSGVTRFAGTWVNDPAADIQWPFPVGVPVSAAYGSASYLAQFSSPHHGVDLAPGAGAEVHVIADGTVRLATEGGGDYGVNVIVDHVIDGQLISTRYAHMQYGSLRVSAGDTVSVGDVLGKAGSTGKATGPHLHFEVLLNGSTRIDPYTWMQQHTEP